MTDQDRVRIAALWLYVVAVATLLNSLLTQLYSRFIDLLAGLWFTQATDAAFVGLRSIEPEGAPPGFEILSALIVDALIVLFLIALARRISRRSRGALAIGFVIYALDTAIFALILTGSIWYHVQAYYLGWQALTLLVHIAGSTIIYRAWRSVMGPSLNFSATS